MNITDQLAVIRRELADLQDGINPAKAAATIAQAAADLLRHLDPEGNVSPRITHHNGVLIDRYRSGGAA